MTDRTIRDLLQDILKEAGLTSPDGRLLHAYGVTRAQVQAAGSALSQLSPWQKRSGSVAALYILWAAERVRCDYDGTGLSWDFINAALPNIFEGTTVAGFVRLGLDHWQRPLRRGLSGNRLFMYTLLAEGGIPLAVLESAGRHTKVLREMIDEIGSRGGIAGLGYETAHDLAHQKMRYLPNILKDRDSVALFLDLAQAIFDLRAALPLGLEGDQRQAWLDRERPGWQRDLPLRLTPQILDNIIRPSLAAPHVRDRPKSAPALREIHLRDTGAAVPVAILAPQAVLPGVALPGAEAAVLRLVPRFATRRPFVYRALRSAEGPNRELERLGASGPEVVPLNLFTALDFDVMADSQSLGPWSALTALPPPEEAPSLWAISEGNKDRLRQVSGGRTRGACLWVALPSGQEQALGTGLAVLRRIEIAGASLLEVHGQGLLHSGDQTLRIATGADSDSETASLFFFGKTLPSWRQARGEPIYLGRPLVYGQRGDGALLALSATQLRRSTRPGSHFGAEFCEWWVADERLAFARALILPADLRIDTHETAEGGASVVVSGLPDGLLLDLRAGAAATHGRGAAALTLPPRRSDTAFMTLSLTEIATGRRLDLTAPWPSTQPHFIQDGAVLPKRDLDRSFDEIAGLSYLAPGSRCQMMIELAEGRSFEIRVSGLTPLLRHEALLRRMMVQGTADNTVSLSLQNSAGQTGRIHLRRYHGQMALKGDRLTLGLSADLARGAMWDPVQRPGHATLQLLQVETGEEHEVTADLTDAALDLREATGIESGLWLVQGRMDGLQQRPVAWMATPPSVLTAPRTSRDDRIAKYRESLQTETNAARLRALLALILVARDGGDPAMLDQFHALARSPKALARMLFVLPATDVSALFALDGHWAVFWPGFPVAELLAVVQDVVQSMTHRLAQASIPGAAAMAHGTVVERLALLRVLRPDMAGHWAIVLVEAGLMADVARDPRFEGLLLPKPQTSLDEALQLIARSDLSLPRGITPLRPRVLPWRAQDFQQTVQLTMGAALATAEAALRLVPKLGATDTLNASLIETAAPELFARALHPALLLALTASRT